MKGPSEQSAKKPVSRLREVPGLRRGNQSNLYMDPRFDSAVGKADLQATRRRYAFLDKYREDEIDQMKQQATKTRDPHEYQTLKKAIESQKSRLETFRKRDQVAKVMSQIGSKKISRAKKRELVLKDRFENMKSKDANRLIERRRRKVAQKQKKNLPERRGGPDN